VRACVCMGARRRKLNRELLGIDREAEKDEESFGFKGCRFGAVVLARVSPRLLGCFLRIVFTPPALCNRFFIF